MFDYKSLSDAEISSLLPPELLDFKVSLLRHQLISVVFALDCNRNRVAYFHGVGTGKTISALITAKLYGAKKILVICPISAIAAWKRDIKKATDFSYTILTGSRRRRLKRLCKKRQIYIINYDGLKTVYADKGKGGWLIDHDKFIDQFDCIICDEVHKLHESRSLQSRICRRLSERAKYTIALTGTPIDNSLLELWGIYLFIDNGATLGTNFMRYRSHYFYKAGFEWKPKKFAKNQILDRIINNTITFKRTECFDLPPDQSLEIPVMPTQEFLQWQDDIIKKDDIVLDGVTYDNSVPSVKGQRLLELSSGFVYLTNDKKEKIAYVLKSNPKLEALLDALETIKSKVVIFHKFIAEGHIIEQALDKKKIRYVSVRGDTRQFLDKNVKSFVQDPKVKVLLAHPACAKESIDLTVASTMIFFSPIASPLVRTQCEGRIKRKNQTNEMLFIDIILEKSVDSSVIKSRTERTQLSTSVLAYIDKYNANKK